jgi:hypothetical protein
MQLTSAKHTDLSVLNEQTAFADIFNVGETARVAYFKLLFRNPFNGSEKKKTKTRDKRRPGRDLN